MKSISKTTLTAVLALMIASGSVLAQTTAKEPAANTAPTPGIEAVKTTIKVRPLLLTDVPLNEPRAIDLGSLSLPGVSPSLTEGVTVKAYTRYVEFEGQRIAQVVLAGVEKNGVRETLPSDAFAAQFSVQEPRLDPASDVVVQGDGATLIAALERLAAAAPAEAPAEPQTVAVQDSQQAQQQNSGPSQNNDQASSWQSPDPVTIAAEPDEAVRVTSAGCPVRIDVPGMRAIQQSRTETTKGGAVVSETECSDDLSSTFVMNKSYTVCTDQVDITALTASARYVVYYVDAGGARQDVTECAADPEKVFPIVEKAEACSIFLDFQSNKAVPQSALVYRNENGVEVQVRGCEASGTKPAVPMTQTNNGCSIRHEYASNKSFQQGTFVYLIDGVQYQAGGCADSGVEYPHSKIYDNSAGGYVCSPVVDLSGNQVTLQSRVQITVDNVSQFITDCTPDTSAQAISAITIGCENPSMWEHNITAGVTYGQERFYFTRNGKSEYVTDCQNSQVVYPHQVETTGWQAHDDQLFAYALSTVYIMPPSGRYNVKTSEVLQGATQMPYELTGTATQANGQVSYVGCDKYADTDQVEQWKRPDLTVYGKPIGPGTPVGPTYSCVRQGGTSAASWTKTGKTYSCSSSIPGYINIGNAYGIYSATSNLVRDDGTIVSSATSTQTGSTFSSATDSACKGNGGGCSSPCSFLVTGILGSWYNGLTVPATPNGSDVSAWVATLGWQ